MYAADEVPDEPRGPSGGRGRPQGDAGREAPRADRPPRRDYARPQQASRDPFFDKPYEASAADAAPAWEPSAARPAVRSISANIKPKRRVAALFKTDPQPAVESATESESSAS